MAIPLCRLTDIPDGGARGFELPQARLFAVRKNRTVYVYLNRCPHLGLPLEWERDNFLDTEGLYIRCANHGAFFALENGECIQGPCQGDSLWAVDYRIDAGMIVIDPAELPAAHGPA